MPTIHYTDASGSTVDVNANVGDSVMETAVRNGVWNAGRHSGRIPLLKSSKNGSVTVPVLAAPGDAGTEAKS